VVLNFGIVNYKYLSRWKHSKI